MDKDLLNIIFSIFGILFLMYVIYKLYYNFSNREGLTSGSTASPTSTTDGVAGNATAYAASIKSSTIKLQDMMLISKYRPEYETVILNLDDYINYLMLQTALSVDTTNPNPSIFQLAKLQQAKNALNDTMLFIDKQ